MLKIISFLIVIAIVGAFVRMAFLKLNPNRTVQPKSDFKLSVGHHSLDPAGTNRIKRGLGLAEAIIDGTH